MTDHLEPTLPKRSSVVMPQPEDQEKPPLNPIKEDGETESITSISPPDGGWGWVIVFASFMIHIVGELIYIIEYITVLCNFS